MTKGKDASRRLTKQAIEVPSAGALDEASLQASLRSQALHAHSDLAALIGDVDRLVYATSPNHLYASLFYAEHDTTTRLLRCRLENLLRTCRDHKPEKIIRCIPDEVAAFTGGGSQRDDVTLMAIRVQEDTN